MMALLHLRKTMSFIRHCSNIDTLGKCVTNGRNEGKKPTSHSERAALVNSITSVSFSSSFSSSCCKHRRAESKEKKKKKKKRRKKTFQANKCGNVRMSELPNSRLSFSLARHRIEFSTDDLFPVLFDFLPCLMRTDKPTMIASETV